MIKLGTASGLGVSVPRILLAIADEQSKKVGDEPT
jgi:hypothetical protein